MKKSTIAVIAILVVLAIGVAVLAVLNSQNAEEKKQQLADEYLYIHVGGVEYKITLEEFLSFEQQEFEANYKKNNLAPESRTFAGVPFAEILRAKGIAPAGFGSAVFAAADSYAQALSMADALDEENCFIVYDDGADGPFRMILPKDQFSQRWVKLLTDITLK